MLIDKMHIAKDIIILFQHNIIICIYFNILIKWIFEYC